MAGFGDVAYAGQFRDLISRIARRVVNQERPEVRIGKVFSYDEDTQTAMILFPGDTIENLTRVRVAQDRCPTSTMIETFDEAGYNAPANIVRIWGKPGDYFILDYYAGLPFSSASVIPGEIKLWPDSSAPAGYLRCDGTTYSTADYPDLAAVLGVRFGGISGTNFVVPTMETTPGLDTDWIPVTFQNEWADYGSAYGTAAYRRVGNRVKFKGLIRNGTAAAVMFTLPYGFRPVSQQLQGGVYNSLATGGASPNTSGSPGDNVTSSVSGHTHNMKNHSHSIAHTHVMSNLSGRINVQTDGTVVHGSASHGVGYLDLTDLEFFTADPWPGSSGASSCYIIKT